MNFRLGINYWPANKAMYWWRRFDADEARADFEPIPQRRLRFRSDFPPLGGSWEQRFLPARRAAG